MKTYRALIFTSFLMEVGMVSYGSHDVGKEKRKSRNKDDVKTSHLALV